MLTRICLSKPLESLKKFSTYLMQITVDKSPSLRSLTPSRLLILKVKLRILLLLCNPPPQLMNLISKHSLKFSVKARIKLNQVFNNSTRSLILMELTASALKISRESASQLEKDLLLKRLIK